MTGTTADARTPYLTIVATTRNDEHGGGMLRRMQVFVDGLAAQAERHRLDAELILVEWNPPPDRVRLDEALAWPRAQGRLCVRIVEVPPDLHARFAYSDRLPLFQMIAKNAGIRRARGGFVLATNVDLLFSDGIVEALAVRSLEKGYLYRVDRHDVESGLPDGLGVADQLAWCERHVIRISTRRGTRDLRTGAVYPIYGGLADLPRYLVAAAANHPGRLLAEARRATLTEADRPTGHRSAWATGRRLVLRSRVRPYTNACGDFTLLAREHWHELRGYPELEMYSLHIDSLLLYMSRYAGIRERILPDPVYHLEHDTGFKPDPDGRAALYRALARAGVPWLTGERFGDYVVEMAETRRPLDLNGEDWGLGSEPLPEREFTL
jgi:hypothetical protein